MKSLLYFGRRRAARKAAAVRFLKEELSEGKFEEKRDLGKVATVPLSRLLLLLLLFNRVQICPLNLKETLENSIGRPTFDSVGNLSFLKLEGNREEISRANVFRFAKLWKKREKRKIRSIFSPPIYIYFARILRDI